MANDMTESELMRVRDWANLQLATGEEPPWSSFLLNRLVETIEALLAGKAADATSDTSASGAVLRLVISNPR